MNPDTNTVSSSFFHSEETGPALFDLLDRFTRPAPQPQVDVYTWDHKGLRITCDMNADCWNIGSETLTQAQVDTWCCREFKLKRHIDVKGLCYVSKP